MAKVTWLGEDSLHSEGNGPRSNEWNGFTFVKGEALEISDAEMIAKAKNNPFYKMESLPSSALGVKK